MRENMRLLRRRKVERELRAGQIERVPPTPEQAAALADFILKGRSQDLSLTKLATIDVDVPCVPCATGSLLSDGSCAITMLEYAAAGAESSSAKGAAWKPRLAVVQALLKAGASPSPSVPGCLPILRSVLYPQTRVHIAVAVNRMRRAASTARADAAEAAASAATEANGTPPQPPCCHSCGTELPSLTCGECGGAMCERCFWQRVDGSRGAELCAASCPSAPPPSASFGGASPPEVKAASLARFLALPADRNAAPKEAWELLAPKNKARSAPLPEAAAMLPGAFQTSRTDNLREAALRGCAWRAKALVDAGVNVDACDEAGVTALILAAWRGNDQVVRMLLAAGSDPNLSVTAGGGNALVGARANGHERCVEALLQGAAAVESPPPGPVAAAVEGILPRFSGLEPKATRMTCWFPRGRCAGDDKGEALNEGGGACFVDGALPPEAVAAFLALAETQSERFMKKPRKTADAGRLSDARDSDAERAHLFDLDGSIRRIIAAALEAAPEARKITGCSRALPGFRFLRYQSVGDQLAEHEDLAKKDIAVEEGGGGGQEDAAPITSTHTLIVYLTGNNAGDHQVREQKGEEEDEEGSSGAGGQTVLLSRFTPVGGTPEPLSECSPVSGRILLFPHACPHLAKPVLQPPKLLLRGECI